MHEIIDSEQTLEQILLRHTNSKKITYELRHWALQSLGVLRRSNRVEYLAYSRGPSTLMFGRDFQSGEVFLSNVWPKYTRKAYLEGIDTPILQALDSYFKNGAKILGSWSGSMRIQLYHVTMTEQDVEYFFHLGFTTYWSMPNNEGVLVMK